MIWGLFSRERWTQLGDWAADEWDQLAAAIQTFNTKEHHDDGTHSAVTADAVHVTGKLRLSGVVRYTAPDPNATGRIDNLYVAGLETASVLKIRNTASGVTLTGIDARNRNVGDLLLVINDDLMISDPTDFAVAADDTNSTAANRFIGGSASSAPWTLHGSQMLLLMYDEFTRTNAFTFKAWRVLMTA